MTEYIGIAGIALFAVAVLRSGSRHVVLDRYYGETGYVLRGEDLARSQIDDDPAAWYAGVVSRAQARARRREGLLYWGLVLVGAAIVVGVYLVARGWV